MNSMYQLYQLYEPYRKHQRLGQFFCNYFVKGGSMTVYYDTEPQHPPRDQEEAIYYDYERKYVDLFYVTQEGIAAEAIARYLENNGYIDSLPKLVNPLPHVKEILGG